MHQHRSLLPARSLLVIALSSALIACGGGSSSSADDDHDHDHEHSGRLLFSVSDDTTLTVYDEEEEAFEPLEQDAADHGAQLVLADNGLSAAVLASGTLNIVYSGLHAEDEEENAEEDHGEHEHAEMLEVSLSSVDQVVTTRGHFSALSNSATQLLPTADVEAESLAFEDTTGPVSQTYPALVLDEEHGLTLFFAADQAHVYEDVTAETTFACADPQGHAEAGELTVLNCDGSAVYVLIEEHEDHHHIHHGDVDFTSATTISGLTSNGHDVVVWNGTAAWVLEAAEHEHVDVMVVAAAAEEEADVSAEALTLALGGATICTAAFATEDEESLGVLSSDGKLHILNLETAATTTIVLDETASPSCSGLTLANGPEAFLVADKAAGLLYMVDAHDGPYHIHTRLQDDDMINLSNLVFMHAIDASHDHADHDE